MTCTISSFFVTLTVFLLWRVSEIAEACSCSPVHPQQAFCNADVVIRAKVGAEQEVFSGNDINGYPIQWIQYDIKQIKMFKGPAHDIEAIFTVCGVPLEANGKKEYLIAGKAEADGKMLVTLCDLIMPWDTMSSAQQRSLNLRYQMGCECKITWCLRPPCSVSAPAECIWTDWVSENKIFGQQAKYLSCIKRADGSCSWTAAWPRPRRHGPTQ